MKKLVPCFLIAILFALPTRSTENSNLFPVPRDLELQIQFWVNVYTKYSIHQRIIHDGDNPERIYKVIDFRFLFPDRNPTRKEKIHILKKEKKKIVKILKKLGSDKTQIKNLSPEELRIYRLFGKHPQKKLFLRATRCVRIQGGMREAFREGIVRSGRYLSAIQEIFQANGIPEELAYLPHVESSFNPQARSRSGAVGIWQFTRMTGKHYLSIHRKKDERKDPLLSTIAAAKLLKHYYDVLGTWPLAITAYNYGLAGMQRAVRTTKTTDIGEIIKRYKSRKFGFASRNFYTEFLAALWVAKEPADYFKNIVLDPPSIPAAKVSLVIEKLDRKRKIIRQESWTKNVSLKNLDNFFSNVDELYSKVEPFLKVHGNVIVVQPEETLGHYADWLELPTNKLRKLNKLRYGQKIRIGQKLRLSFRNVSPKIFEERRSAYHRLIQQKFFQKHKVNNCKVYTVRPGETFWTMAKNKFGIPLWLFVAWNRDENPNCVIPGQQVRVPVVTGVGD